MGQDATIAVTSWWVIPKASQLSKTVCTFAKRRLRALLFDMVFRFRLVYGAGISHSLQPNRMSAGGSSTSRQEGQKSYVSYTLYVGGQTSMTAAMGLAPSVTPTRSLFPVDSTLGTSSCGKLYVFRQGVKETRTQMFSYLLKSSILVANEVPFCLHT